MDKHLSNQNKVNKNKINEVRRNIIGFSSKVFTPFGKKTSLYVDNTATGRPYKAIEDLVQQNIKKMYANSHTETSSMGNYSTQLLHYAQQSILKSFKVTDITHFAIPTNHGATGAFEKLIKILRIQSTDELGMEKNQEKPIVYITAYEHHSNILPWHQFCCQIEVLSSDDMGNIDMKDFAKKLQANTKSNKKQILSLSATSNVTSQLTDMKAINKIIKEVKSQYKQNQIIFSLDCAAFISHDRMDLSSSDYSEVDFLCFSPHKNLGGSESTGILLGKKSAYNSKLNPSFPGGGTVKFVTGTTESSILYENDIFTRELPGTPNTIGFYRAALSLELQDYIGLDLIKIREEKNASIFFEGIKSLNEDLKSHGKFVQIYGQQSLEKRFDVFSFNVMVKEGKHTMEFLVDGYKCVHPHYIAKLMNDVYGIQLRSGCSCAGPFGVKLLQIPSKIVEQIKTQIRNGNDIQKPGWVRLDTFFALEKFEIEYILEALKQIIIKGDNLAHLYVQEKSGQFRMHNYNQQHEDFSLQNMMQCSPVMESNVQDRQIILQQQAIEGRQIMESPESHIQMNKNDKQQNYHNENDETASCSSGLFHSNSSVEENTHSKNKSPRNQNNQYYFGIKSSAKPSDKYLTTLNQSLEAYTDRNSTIDSYRKEQKINGIQKLTQRSIHNNINIKTNQSGLLSNRSYAKLTPRNELPQSTHQFKIKKIQNQKVVQTKNTDGIDQKSNVKQNQELIKQCYFPSVQSNNQKQRRLVKITGQKSVKNLN